MTISRGRRVREHNAGAGTVMVGESKVETGRNESASIAADGASSRCVRALEPPMIGLMRVIEREIIPRLFLAHLPDGSGFPRGSAVPVTDNEIAAFAEFVLLSDQGKAGFPLQSGRKSAPDLS